MYDPNDYNGQDDERDEREAFIEAEEAEELEAAARREEELREVAIMSAIEDAEELAMREAYLARPIAFAVTEWVLEQRNERRAA